MDVDRQTDNAVHQAGTSTDKFITPPAVLRNVTIGINEVTKRLEEQCKVPRRVLCSPSANESEDRSGSVRTVLVCRPDIDPPLLVAHILPLVAACNNVLKALNETVKLVTLPKGAEFALSQAVGLRRVAIVALDVRANQLICV